MDSAASWAAPAARLYPCFQDVDTSFVNLEACLDVAQLAARPLIGLGQIVSAPASVLCYLREIRSRAVGIANNHSYDFGETGVVNTKRAIARYDMAAVGAGITLADSPQVFVWPGPAQIRVGFWAAARATADAATRARRGVEPATLARAKQALAEMTRQGADFRVALLHSGCMRSSRPDPSDLSLMESIAKIGFDVVAASHSHRIAGYRRLRGKSNHDAFCFFGLGSVVSGYASAPVERDGLVVVASIGESRRLHSIEVRPVLLDEMGFGTVPLQTEASAILERFHNLSAEIDIGTYKREFYREASRGIGAIYARDAKSAFRSAGFRGIARRASRIRVRHLKRLMHKVIGR